ncbi:MAG TPA: FmdB family zinc ribbon protein [Thermodesulfovibrionales bacterium]|jgi:putative FmdB family regulatory protein|nr:FmdB family zinc ribbon protein [Thermodesulfovibrionales bacterium]
METYEYLCLACKRLYVLRASAEKCDEGKECPHCKSRDVVQLGVSSLFGLSGG